MIYSKTYQKAHNNLISFQKPRIIINEKLF